MMSIKDWTQIKVKEICDIGRGRVISSQEIESRLGIYPVFSSQSQNRGEMGRIDTYDFDGEYVTWTTDGAYAGTVFYREGKFNCTNVCGTLKANSPQISMEFLAYKLSTLAKNYVSYVGNPKLMNNVMANIELSLPDNKKEQEQIADVLSTIDRASAQTEAIIAKQQRIKTGLMQDLLTKGVDEHGNIRSEATHEFKDSAIGRIPVEWKVQGLASLLENIYQGWSPDCESHSALEDEWGVLKTTSVTWDGYDSQENKKLPSSLKPRLSLEIKKGDVLITRAGPNSRVGVICYVYETLSKKILSDKIYKLKFHENLDPRFFVYSLSGSASQQYLSTLKTGMAESQTNISQEIVKTILTVVPSAHEQSAIANLLDKNLQSCQEHLLIRNKLYLIKTGLMQDLLTGKVRVTNLLNQKAATN
ncbi:restriction endonuclease subunit S [Microcoleus sp. LAD1_D3]|uniref:restriction endonuclease subunit S n=1 Tax=Microcoleus sp. LAD1_D3 TaxID=2819365 RepID=UPI002FD3CE0D